MTTKPDYGGVLLIVAIALVGTVWAGLAWATNAPTVAINAPGALPRLMAIAVGLILLSGIFLAVKLGALGYAWVRVSFASMVLMGLLGWPSSM